MLPLFCLALLPAPTQIKHNLPPGTEIVWYLDDIYIVCEPEQCAHLLGYVTTVLWDMCKINVNLGKLVVWGNTPTACPDDLHAHAPLVERGIKILGSPD